MEENLGCPLVLCNSFFGRSESSQISRWRVGGSPVRPAGRLCHGNWFFLLQLGLLTCSGQTFSFKPPAGYRETEA